MEENKTVELEKRPRVISVFSSKGGVGKTTTSTNIAYNLSQFGYKCLVID